MRRGDRLAISDGSQACFGSFKSHVSNTYVHFGTFPTRHPMTAWEWIGRAALFRTVLAGEASAAGSTRTSTRLPQRPTVRLSSVRYTAYFATCSSPPKVFPSTCGSESYLIKWPTSPLSE